GEHLVARLDALPAEASRLRATADRAHHVTLRRTVAVSLRDDGFLLGLRTLGPGPAEALEPFASIDARTGAVSRTTPAGTPTTDGGGATLDTLPRRLFGMLTLPDPKPGARGAGARGEPALVGRRAGARGGDDAGEDDGRERRPPGAIGASGSGAGPGV